MPQVLMPPTQNMSDTTMPRLEARTKLASFGLKRARDFGLKCDWPRFCLAPVALKIRYEYQPTSATMAMRFAVPAYAPHFALVPVFGVRLALNVRRMLRGDDGPWSALDAHAAAAAKVRDSMSANGAPSSPDEPRPPLVIHAPRGAAGSADDAAHPAWSAEHAGAAAAVPQ